MESGCESVTSYWSSGDMTTPTAQSLLTHDLEVRSAGSSGRALLATLEDYCLDLLGATKPLEFALLLRSVDPRPRQVLEELLEWTAQEPAFQLVALVSLAPVLDQVARRLGHRRPSIDTVSEVLAQASQALLWTHELVEGERVEFVRHHAFTASNTEQIRMARHNMPAVPIPDDFDQAADGHRSAAQDVVDQRLGFAVRRGVISAGERQLIEETRRGGCSLVALAESKSGDYDALRMRRARAESRLRSFYRIDGAP